MSCDRRARASWSATRPRRAGPSVVAIGRHGRGSGFVVGAGPGADQRPQPARRDDRGALRRRPGRAGAVVGSDVDGDLVVLDVDTGDVAAARPGPTTAVDAGRRRRRRDRRPPPPRADVGPGHGDRGAGSAGPRGRPIVGAIEHTAPCGAGLVGRAGARPRRAGRRRQHPPPRARLLPRPRRRRGAARRRRGDGRGPPLRAPARSAWRSPRPTSRPGCAARSGSTSATGCSSAASSRARRPRRPGSARATCSCGPATATSHAPTTCSPCSAASRRAASSASGSSAAPRS